MIPNEDRWKADSEIGSLFVEIAASYEAHRDFDFTFSFHDVPKILLLMLIV